MAFLSNKTGIIIITVMVVAGIGISYLLYMAFTPSKILPPPGTTFIVNDDGSADYTKIQDAINAAMEGDMIFVYSGRYRENITINKSINLIGENAKNTIIDPPEGVGHLVGIYLQASNVKISGFTVEWGGMKIQSSSYCNIANSIISGGGLSLYDSSYIEISHCTPSGNTGILLSNSSNNKITYSKILRNPVGTRLAGGSNHNEITNSWITDSGCGILIISSNYNTIKNCDISDSGRGMVYGGGVLIIDSANNNTVQYCRIADTKYQDYPGIYLGYGTKDNTIHHNNFINNSKAAEDKGQNRWDDSSKGSYWDDYKGKDADRDGIGDTPYSIQGGNSKDNHPFMNSLSTAGIIEKQKETGFPAALLSAVIIIVVTIIAIIVVRTAYKKVGKRNEKKNS